MKLEDVKKMTEDEVWESTIRKNSQAWNLWTKNRDHEAAAELRSDIERRGLDYKFITNLSQIIWNKPAESLMSITAWFQIINATPRQVAEAYLMTVSEEL